MELFVDDDGFVRAPAPLVYRRLTDVAAWDDWWPGVTLRPRPQRRDGSATATGDRAPGADEDTEAWRLTWRDGLLRLRFDVVVGAWRHEHGFGMTLTGDLHGSAEFWLEHLENGTVVHHILVARTDRRRPLRVLRGYRRTLRRGLWAFKDRVQSEVRETAGLLP